jgi:AbrB family looped-hinge helix DNA binding protein
MSEGIIVSLDEHGRIVIPSVFRKRLGLAGGMKLVVEPAEHQGMSLRVHREDTLLVDEDGVLVVVAESTGNLNAVVQDERRRRVSELIQRMLP